MYILKFDTLVFSDKYRFLIIIYNAVWILVSLMLQLYELKQLKRLDRILFNLFKAFTFNALIISAILFSLKASEFSREHLYYTYLMLFILIVVWRYLAIQLIKLYRKSGFNYSRVVIIGGGEVAQQLNNYFDSDDVLGVRLLGIFSDSPISFNTKDEVFLSDLADFEQFVLKHNIDEIFYTMPLTYTRKIKNLVDFCDKYMIRFKIVPDFRGFLFKRVNIDFFDDVPIITLREEPLTDFVNRFLKRMFDLCFSFLVIIFILSWLYPIIAILIKLSSKGPVLFKQLRSGVNNEEFLCYKFRSMTLSSNADTKQATKGDSRVTTIGYFLRKTSLDELPNILNVLKGEMSFVGPRPLVKYESDLYGEYREKRNSIKPGITGLAQIQGRLDLSLQERLYWDIKYVDEKSFNYDLIIILKTVYSVLSRRGAN